MHSNDSTDRPRTNVTSRRRSIALGALLGLAALVALAGTATGFWGHRHGDRFDSEKLRFAVEWVLRGADASPEQVDTIAAIAESAHDDLAMLADGHRENRAAFLAAITAERIDPAAIEDLRLQTVALADAGSTRIAAALVAMAQELSPEQRRELAERFEETHRRHHEDEGAE